VLGLSAQILLITRALSLKIKLSHCNWRKLILRGDCPDETSASRLICQRRHGYCHVAPPSSKRLSSNAAPPHRHGSPPACEPNPSVTALNCRRKASAFSLPMTPRCTTVPSVSWDGQATRSMSPRPAIGRVRISGRHQLPQRDGKRRYTEGPRALEKTQRVYRGT
jgi:hypothetical protein